MMFLGFGNEIEVLYHCFQNINIALGNLEVDQIEFGIVFSCQISVTINYSSVLCFTNRKYI